MKNVVLGLLILFIFWMSYVVDATKFKKKIQDTTLVNAVKNK